MWKHDNLSIIHMGKKLCLSKHTLEVVEYIDEWYRMVKVGSITYHNMTYRVLFNLLEDIRNS